MKLRISQTIRNAETGEIILDTERTVDLAANRCQPKDFPFELNATQLDQQFQLVQQALRPGGATSTKGRPDPDDYRQIPDTFS